jgi:glycosyltransferase involved in cell wall biosynthesis
MSRVSVIIPVRNGEQFIAQAINSILSQTLIDLELLVVNDASTDSTAEIIQSYTDPRLRLLNNKERMGVSASRNRALEEANATYVAFLDGDDIAYADRLNKQIDFLESHPNVVLVGSYLDYIDADGLLLYSDNPGQRPCNSGELRMELLKRVCILPSTATGRKTALVEAGGFPPQDYAEDHDLWCRLATKHDLAILPERLVAYRQHANQASFKRIYASYKATQACINRAKATYVFAGLLTPDKLLSHLSFWNRLVGANGSAGSIYLQWAELYSWALKQPRAAWSLCWMAIFFSPLNATAWMLLMRTTEQVLLPSRMSRALHWYAKKWLGRLR